MEILLAKSAGFCFGVKRAVDTVYEEIEKGGRIYTLGPIIHNSVVVDDLSRHGVEVIDSVDNLDLLEQGTIIIRSHGVSKEVERKLKNSKHSVVDATCPYVKKIHNIVEKESQNGARIVIIGSKNHPEVSAIMGWCDENMPPVVIGSVEEAEKFEADFSKKITIVSQTTFQLTKFQELVEIFEKKGYDVNVVNTICSATALRQNEAKIIAEQVDAMIVIGDSKSSNTQKLFEICSRECKSTQLVQTKEDLMFDSKESLSRVGITAGASTPNKIIEEVQNYVRINF